MLEIKKYPAPVLKKRAEEVREITQEIKELGLEMIKIMLEQEAVGLAAPQVGISKRIFIIQTEQGPKVFINPEIIKISEEKEIGEEGCLSLPGVRLNIKRAKNVLVQAQDIEGKTIEIKAEGLTARIFQHEIDHLNGVLILNRINFWQRWKIKSKLKKHR